MFPSAILCREQETIQRQRAATTPLENVRLIAERAAAAWSLEAKAADDREARHKRVREIRATNAAQAAPFPDQPDRWVSENPDRGFPAPSAASTS